MAESPPILRPIPRRPYELNPTPAFDLVSSPPSPSPAETESSYTNPQGNSGFETPSYLRTASSANLTGSTLYGIYGNEPDTPSTFSSRRQSPVSSLHNFPWSPGFGEGGVPSRAPSFKLKTKDNPRVSSIILARRNSSPYDSPSSENTSKQITAWKIAWRVALLFTIGVCYGLMVFHLQNEGAHSLGGGHYVENIMRTARSRESYNLMYLMFWGSTGVGLGSLLPWIDGLWEERHPTAHIDGKAVERCAPKKTPVLAADWNPVVRSIGVFVGIAFAIRKLPWTSTLQVSLTLTLINPVLWYLVDRSLPGFILSSIIGTFGTFLLLALNPSMMPPPLTLSSSPSNISFSQTGNSSTWDWSRDNILDAQMLEISIWVGSVLFCSVVCFGGIGRRLAIRRTTKT